MGLAFSGCRLGNNQFCVIENDGFYMSRKIRSNETKRESNTHPISLENQNGEQLLPLRHLDSAKLLQNINNPPMEEQQEFSEIRLIGLEGTMGVGPTQTFTNPEGVPTHTSSYNTSDPMILPDPNTVSTSLPVHEEIISEFDIPKDIHILPETLHNNTSNNTTNLTQKHTKKYSMEELNEKRNSQILQLPFNQQQQQPNKYSMKSVEEMEILLDDYQNQMSNIPYSNPTRTSFSNSNNNSSNNNNNNMQYNKSELLNIMKNSDLDTSLSRNTDNDDNNSEDTISDTEDDTETDTDIENNTMVKNNNITARQLHAPPNMNLRQKSIEEMQMQLHKLKLQESLRDTRN